MDDAAGDLGRDLWLLYVHAGKPDLDSVCDRLPADLGLTAAVVQEWLNSGEVPSSLGELTAFIDELNAAMGHSGDSAARPVEHYRSLWHRCRDSPKRSPHLNEAGTSGPEKTPENTTHANRVDGNPRITGSIQAREISGDVHIHADDGAQSSAQHPPVVPIIRVKSESETIEIFEPGLARIWITARLQGDEQ